MTGASTTTAGAARPGRPAWATAAPAAGSIPSAGARVRIRPHWRMIDRRDRDREARLGRSGIVVKVDAISISIFRKS